MLKIKLRFSHSYQQDDKPMFIMNIYHSISFVVLIPLYVNILKTRKITLNLF